jgi:hypothetical protein
MDQQVGLGPIQDVGEKVPFTFDAIPGDTKHFHFAPVRQIVAEGAEFTHVPQIVELVAACEKFLVWADEAVGRVQIRRGTIIK